MTEETASPRPWRVDHTIPIALLIGLGVQFLGVVWYGAQFAARIDAAVAANDRQEVRLGDMDRAIQADRIAAATIAAQLRSVQDGLAEVKQAQSETNDLLRVITRDKP